MRERRVAGEAEDVYLTPGVGQPLEFSARILQLIKQVSGEASPPSASVSASVVARRIERRSARGSRPR